MNPLRSELSLCRNCLPDRCMYRQTTWLSKEHEVVRVFSDVCPFYFTTGSKISSSVVLPFSEVLQTISFPFALIFISLTLFLLILPTCLILQCSLIFFFCLFLFYPLLFTEGKTSARAHCTYVLPSPSRNEASKTRYPLSVPRTETPTFQWVSATHLTCPLHHLLQKHWEKNPFAYKLYSCTNY